MKWGKAHPPRAIQISVYFYFYSYPLLPEVIEYCINMTHTRHVCSSPEVEEDWKLKLKLITISFLSGLCYGPVHVGVYYPWTFVGQIYLIRRLPLSPASTSCSSSLVTFHMWLVLLVKCLCSLVIVVICCCFLYLFLAFGEGASKDCGHECEPLLCFDVDCHDDILCLCWE